jgi:lysophospholipid acyltransferase (LPLAT)-like uncharacterized protein
MSVLPVPQEKIPLDPVSRAIFLFGSLLGRTWRCTRAGRLDLNPSDDKGQGRIYSFWHSHLLPISFFYRNTGKIAVVSESKDGRRAGAVAQRWGHRIIAGSSTRGGMGALRECVRALNERENIAITPDGPRGPREIVKPGVAQIALLTGAIIVPLSAHPVNAWRLKSWDRFMIPKPFTKLAMRSGDPIDPRDSRNEPDPQAHLLAIIQKAMEQ